MIHPAIDPAARARLVEAYAPGARVLRARRLRGGVGARMQVLSVLHADGRREKVVLRSYLPGRVSHTGERSEREFQTIELVREAGVPAATPLFVDGAGEFLDAPSILLGYLPGRPLYVPRDIGSWAEQLTGAMHAIHQVTPASHDLSWLPVRGREETADELKTWREERFGADDELLETAMSALEAHIDRIDWERSCLIHADFWPGNTIWFRGRLIGVIDWSNARLGHPLQDVSQCCVDALWINGAAEARAVRDAYSRVSGDSLIDHWYFDLFVGLAMLRSIEVTLLGYHDTGLTFVTPEIAQGRTRDLMREALRTGATRAS